MTAPPKSDSLLARHWAAFVFAFLVVAPVILRTGRRPVIFSRWSGMGDIICTIPAARKIIERHPGATFIYNCHPDSATIPRLAGVAQYLTSLKHIGLIGHWYRFLLAGFYHFSHGDDLAESGCHEPMVTEFLRQFALPLSEEHPELPVTMEAREKVDSVLAQKNLDVSRLVLIHPGLSWPVREWPHENWVQLVSKLREHGLMSIAQLGMGRYLNFGRVEVPLIPGAFSLLDAFTVEECIAAIARAKLFIGIDSGLLHIAATTRTPSVGIFGATLPEYRFSEQFRKNFILARVECVGCEHRKPQLHWITGCPFEIKCMKTVGVDEVLQAALMKLDSAKVASPTDP
jgi:ADP-heptose:LPS heptosyltransferase